MWLLGDPDADICGASSCSLDLCSCSGWLDSGSCSGSNSISVSLSFWSTCFSGITISMLLLISLPAASFTIFGSSGFSILTSN
ncbi:hypothetical protein HanIR_Chr13g0617141 [Helianthus annuus]|nr:hypothetical protein HanIR_Chr13g0617141 [Helianthus annuus]